MYSYNVLIASSLFFATIFLYLYWYLKRTHRYFRDAGIPYIEPHWLFGNMKESILQKKSFFLELAEIYEKLEPHKFAGMYILHNKIFMIRDPELIKRILVKDFHYFQDHGLPFSKKHEPLDNHLFNMEGEEWKNLRIKMTGTFTSGKMKMMFPLVRKCAEGIRPALMEYVSNADGLEIRDLCARYTTDVISSCAFGIDTHSLQDPDSEFRKMGKRIFEVRWQSFFRAFFRNTPDWCIEWFNLHTFNKAVTDYFMEAVKAMVKYREEHNISRGDFLDLLIAMKNHKDIEKLRDQQEEADLAKFMAQIGNKCMKSDVEMTIELAAAQCFVFFFAGFEGTAAAVAFLLFELAQHPDIQDATRAEIVNAIERNGGEVTYDMLKELPYLNMVLSETMRLHSINSSVIVRKCKENYKIPDSEVIIKEGMQIFIPMIGVHLDKKYFEKPNEFYPEHFTKEAIAQRPHCAYLPFGDGPRICIAERFARMQMLMGAVYLIKDFSFELSPKTKLPLEFLSTFGVLPVKGGLWLKCHPL